MKKKNGKWVRICPRCGSKDVKGGSLLGIFPKPYKCQNCGFVSHLFPETTLKEAKKNKVKIRTKIKPKAVKVNIEGQKYGLLSIVIGIIGFISPLFIPFIGLIFSYAIRIFFGMLAITLGRSAIKKGFGTLGRIGAIIGFVDIIFFIIGAMPGV